jgi:hypothetical protein
MKVKEATCFYYNQKKMTQKIKWKIINSTEESEIKFLKSVLLNAEK